jgi:hypothetical protein
MKPSKPRRGMANEDEVDLDEEGKTLVYIKTPF